MKKFKFNNTIKCISPELITKFMNSNELKVFKKLVLSLTNKCFKCNSKEQLLFKYKKPIRQYFGLKFKISNTFVVCKSCNEEYIKQRNLALNKRNYNKTRISYNLSAITTSEINYPKVINPFNTGKKLFLTVNFNKLAYQLCS